MRATSVEHYVRPERPRVRIGARAGKLYGGAGLGLVLNSGRVAVVFEMYQNNDPNLIRVVQFHGLRFGNVELGLWVWKKIVRPSQDSVLNPFLDRDGLEPVFSGFVVKHVALGVAAWKPIAAHNPDRDYGYIHHNHELAKSSDSVAAI